jgi:Mor family transcriptional regulator
MKVKELIKIGEKLMKMLHERGIKMEDYQHLPMTEEFDMMKNMGHKTTYIIAHLAEKYDICERKVYKIIGKMILDCTF